MDGNECTTKSCCETEAANASHEAVIDYIGPRIKELCEKLHLSRYRLAQRSGVSLINITRYIDGRKVPALSTVEKLCRGFDISLSQFFENGGYQPDPALPDDQNELLNYMNCLNEEGRNSLLTYARFLAEQEAMAAASGEKE